MRMLKYFVTMLLAVAAALVVPTAAHAAPTWVSSTIAPGATQEGVWGDVPAGITYEVGLSPLGATPSSPCWIEITRTWWVQQSGGAREFHFWIKNIGTISCATMIILRELPVVNGTWQLPNLSPGATTTKTWNNVPTNHAYSPGLMPGGATGSSACKLEVTRRWDKLWFNGQAIEREFQFTVKNVGSITCTGLVLLGAATDNSPINGSLMNVGDTNVFAWNVTSPADKSFVVGVKPSHNSVNGDCVFEITRRWYTQRVVNGNSLTREIGGHVANVGTMTCAPHILVA